MINFFKVFWKTQKTIWLFLGDQRPKYLFFNGLILVVFFYDFVPAFVFGKIVDFFSNYTKGDTLAPFVYLSVFLGISWTLVSIVRISCKNVLARIGIHTRTNTRVLGLERLLDLSTEWHSDQNSGNRVQQVFTGSSAILEAIQLVYRDIWKMFANFIGIIVFFLFVSPVFAVFMIGYSLAFFVVEFYFNRQIYQLTEIGNKLLEKATGSIIETTSNIVTIKSLGFEKEIHGHLMRKEEVAKQIQLKKQNLKSLKWIMFHIVNGIGLGVFLYLLGHNVINGFITIGSILIFFAYFNKLREATVEAADHITAFTEISSNINRLQDIFDSTKLTTRKGRSYPKDWQEIVFDDVTFGYASSGKGLTGLNLTIKKGDVLGVAGASGGGKSTLAKLLIDLYQPDSGVIRVGGIPYQDISHDEIIKATSIVPQEAELFNMSMRENITMLRDVSPELLETVIRVCELEKVIEKLPDGLETLIGEKGYMLSGGERQRVGIARALCKDSSVTVFDEATSSLDGKLEKNIVDNVMQAFKGKKTFIFIAHRLSALEPADHIIVFENGALVQAGAFEELKSSEGIFAEIFKTQIKNHE